MFYFAYFVGGARQTLLFLGCQSVHKLTYELCQTSLKNLSSYYAYNSNFRRRQKTINVSWGTILQLQDTLL